MHRPGNRLTTEQTKFLIVRTDRIGDVLLTLPMARALKHRMPDSRVTMLIREYTREIVSADRNVDQVITCNGEHSSFRATLSEVRAAGFDVVFHTHPRFTLALLTALAGIPVRVGTGYRWYSFLFNRRVFEHRKDARRHELEYNLNLLRSVGCEPPGGIRPEISILPRHTEAARRVLDGLGIPRSGKLVILHPGSGGSARDWHWRNFAALAGKLHSLGGIDVLVTGGKGEEKLVESVRSASGAPLHCLVNAVGILEYAAITAEASLFIANSTGTLHVAAAAGTPVIGLYPQIRPLSAARWGPYTEAKTIFSPAGMPDDCRKCLDSGSDLCECMESIRVDDVFRAARTMLGVEEEAR